MYTVQKAFKFNENNNNNNNNNFNIQFRKLKNNTHLRPY